MKKLVLNQENCLTISTGHMGNCDYCGEVGKEGVIGKEKEICGATQYAKKHTFEERKEKYFPMICFDCIHQLAELIK